MKTPLVPGGLLLVLLIPNYAILRKEQLVRDGTVVLLELAPVDPRSLIQGDYMRLEYAIARELSGFAPTQVPSGRILPGGARSRPDLRPAAPRVPRDGHIVIRLDDRSVAKFVRWHDERVPLATGEHLLQYRRRNDAIRLATDAFHFQEGHAGRYEVAQYGELRVAASGESVLVGLRDSLQRALR